MYCKSLILGAFQLLVLLPLPVPYALAAEPSPLAAPNAPEDPESAVAVADAQKISLKFSEVPRLNGDYRVNADETISIPGLGRISVSGMNPSQLEKALSDAATGLAGREIYVTVEVSEYKPVSIAGDVPFRAVPWRPGLTVEQAIAGTGGGAQPASDDTIVQQRKARLDKQRLMALMARLQAEQQDAAEIQIPPQLVQLAGETDAARLVQLQQTLLQNRRAAVTKQLEMLGAGKAVANDELESLRVQRSKIEEQLQMRRKQRDRIQALFEQKLTVADRALEENIKVSDLEEKAANLSVAVARVQSTLVGFNRETLNVVEVRRAEVDAELVRVERELAQLSAVLGTSDGPQAVTYSITRGRGKAASTSSVTRASLLMPGDLLTVAEAAGHTE
jgi:exopolysaccharide production protein ExoF